MKMQKLCPVKAKYSFTYEEQNFQYLWKTLAKKMIETNPTTSVPP